MCLALLARCLRTYWREYFSRRKSPPCSRVESLRAYPEADGPRMNRARFSAKRDRSVSFRRDHFQRLCHGPLRLPPIMEAVSQDGVGHFATPIFSPCGAALRLTKDRQKSVVAFIARLIFSRYPVAVSRAVMTVVIAAVNRQIVGVSGASRPHTKRLVVRPLKLDAATAVVPEARKFLIEASRSNQMPDSIKARPAFAMRSHIGDYTSSVTYN